MEGLLTSALMLSGGASDLANSEIGPLIERYFRGGAPSTKEHLRLQSGELDRMRQRLYNQYKDPAPAERMMRFIKG